MVNEDFGYVIKKEQSSTKNWFLQKPLKMIAVLLSLISFILITISAYYFSRTGQSDEIQIVKSPDYDIKIRTNSKDIEIKNIDKSVYDNISGSSDIEESKINVIESQKAVSPKEPDFGSNITRYLDSEVKMAKKQVQNNEVENQENSLKSIKRKANSNSSAQKSASTSSKSKKSASSNKSDQLNPINQKPYVRVQLAALKSRDSAYNYWLKLKKNHPKLFFDLKYYIQAADLGKRGIFYRLQIGNFRGQLKAEEFCLKFITQAKKKKTDCIIVE